MHFPSVKPSLFRCLIATSMFSSLVQAHSALQQQELAIEQGIAPPVVAEGEEPSLLEQAAIVEALPPILLHIQFTHNEAKVEQNFYPEIEKLAIFLDENPNHTVVIEGHTDDLGEADYNQIISEERAQAIADVLVEIFRISENRVSAIGYGEERPLFSNDTLVHRKANRRVTAVIFSNEV